MRLELTRSCDHYPLKVACIPISPPALGCPEQDSNLHTSRHAHLKRTRLPIPPSGQKKRAENETRTRDPNLGKVVLYQLSYFRNFFFVIRRIIRSLNRKRVQKYCFFLTYANFSAFFLHFFAFYGAVRVRVRTLNILYTRTKGKNGPKWALSAFCKVDFSKSLIFYFAENQALTKKMQKKCIFFVQIFGHMKKKQYFCTRF